MTLTWTMIAMGQMLAFLTDPVTVRTNPVGLLWALPICLSIAIVYKAVKLEDVTDTKLYLREVGLLWATIIGFLILVALVLLAIAQFVRR